MKKRYVALLCLVALFVGVFALGIKAEAATNYQVGYAIVDINPWVDPNDHSLGLIEGLHLGGQGSKDNLRYAYYVHDDDGDGNVTYNYTSNDDNTVSVKSWSPDPDGGDGLHATCIAVTDSKGTTALFISVDALSAYGTWLSDVRKSIEERLGADVIRQENIIMSGSHTHASLKFNSADQLTGKDAPYRYYYDRVIKLITDAAEEAMKDRASATMHKATVDASNVTGFQMNFQRHWQVEAYDAYDKSTTFSGTKTFAKPYDVHFISGSNFARLNDLRNYIANKEGLLPKPVPSGGKGVVFDTDPSGQSGYFESDVVTTDDKMHLIQFKFSDTSKKPIVMVNWRAHTTEAGGDYAKYIYENGKLVKMECELSSDYVGPLRALMKKNGYRMSFFLGGSGNLVINQFNSNKATVTKWRSTIKRNATTKVALEGDCDAYGRLLWQVAQSGLNSTAMKTVQTPGDIMTVSSRTVYNRQVDSDGLREALEAVKAEHPDDFNSNWDYYPYYYTSPKDGKLYIINSYFHAGSINSRMNNTAESTVGYTMSVVTLGKAAAFAVVPFEIADRYSNDNPFKTNDWDTLATKGFGTPFVLSCSNGGNGYLPHSMEYIYNTEEYYQKTGTNQTAPTYFGPGSYEANTTPSARGTGEQMVARLGELLDSVGKNTRTAYCEACKETVTWQPLYSYSTSPQYDGHYYLAEDMPNAAKIIVYKYRKVCLDLNGKTFATNGTAFHTYSDGPELNVMDSVGTGKVIGTNASTYSSGDSTQYRGGVIVISGKSTVNIYGGTFLFEKSEAEGCVPLSQGGIACVLGTLNMYGGKMEGVDLEVTDWVNAEGKETTNNGYGAAIFVADGATFTMTGGTVTAGTVPASGEGRCVYLAGAGSKAILSGNGKVDEIMLNSIYNRAQLNVVGDFKGYAPVALAKSIKSACTVGNYVGMHDNASIYANAMPVYRYSDTDPNNPTSDVSLLLPIAATGRLEIISFKTANCPVCGKSEKWIPIYNTNRIPGDVTGHYYLKENITADNGIRIVAEKDCTVCLELDAKTYEVNDTALHPYQYGSINIMDSTYRKLGKITSHPGSQTIGGVALISAHGTVNLYAGTLSYAPTAAAPSGVVSGGVAYIYGDGVLNMYGGKLQGAELVIPAETTVSTPGLGAAVTVLGSGKLNVAGGTITSGTTPKNNGECVYIAAKAGQMELSGNAKVEKVLANWTSPDMFTVKGEYTGETGVIFNQSNTPLVDGLDIGNSDNASFAAANLTVLNAGNYSIKTSGTNLVLSSAHNVAILAAEDDADPQYFASLADAVSMYEGGIIRLLASVSEDVALAQDTYIDLNGFNINGTVTVEEGKTLYGMDIATDDYDIEDGVYGKITSVSGTVKGAAAIVQGAKDYLMVTETSGVSFHRVNLTLTTVTFNPLAASIRYKTTFEGDRLVAANVKQFGVACRLGDAPTADAMREGTYSAFTDFKAGKGMNGTTPSTAVINIMNNGRTDYLNGLYATRPVFGSAYILTNDGEYYFGYAQSRSLKEVVEYADTDWDDLSEVQQTAMRDLYKQFTSVMSGWNLPNVRDTEL